MHDKPVADHLRNVPERHEATRPRRWRTLLVPILLLGGLLWVSNWFYQRARLFRDSHVELGAPFLPWGKLIGDQTARELFGMPVELHPNDKHVSWYQIGLIAGYTPLKSLHLNGVTDADVRRLRGLMNLQSLSLYDSPITDEACEVVGRFEKLKTLGIRSSDGRTQARLTDDGLVELTHLPQLSIFDLQAPGITDDGLDQIARLSTLTNLTLENAQIRGEKLGQLAKLPLLRSLGLHNCPLEGDCLRQLADCPSLFALTLYDSTVTDDMLPSLIPVGSLRTVHLVRTQVTPEGCRALLAARPDLHIVDADNQPVTP